MVVSRHIAVLGAGSWGTALAILLANNGHGVRLWGRNEEKSRRLAAQRCNEQYLPGHPFPDKLHIAETLEAAVVGAGLVLVAVPSKAFPTIIAATAVLLENHQALAWVTKGFDPGRARLLHEVVAERIAPQISVGLLSGPTFAVEVAAGLPSAITAASADAEFARTLAHLFGTSRFRVYTSDDVIGVEVGGAVKNVLAVAAGIADGLGFGANTRAAMIARGLAELMRLGVALGGRQETFMGLAGLGDLVLTCTDNQSRNRRFGLALAAGTGVDEAQAAIGQVVEAVATSREVRRIAASVGVEMPIAEQVAGVLHDNVLPATAVEALLARATGDELS